MAESRPNIAVVSAIKAHFKQPAGPSRPGTDWSVAITQDGVETRVMVRTYHDDMGSLSDQEQAYAAMRHVAMLLESGWRVSDYAGEPGELTAPAPVAGPEP